MTENVTNSGELGYCDQYLVTYYWSSPAVGCHLYTVITLIVIGLIVVLFGTLANVLVILVYINNVRLKSRSNSLVVVLACTDLLMTAFLRPLFIASYLNETTGNHSCALATLTRLVAYFCYGTSLLTVTLISIERWLTLAFPYKHHDMLTNSRLKVIVVLMWLFSLAFDLSLLGLMPYTVSMLISASISLTCFLVMLSVWLWIYRLLRRHLNRIEALSNTPGPTLPPTLRSISSSEFNKTTFNTNTTCLLVTGHLLCYLPIIAFPF